MKARIVRRLLGSALVAGLLSAVTPGIAHAGMNLGNHNEILIPTGGGR
jgi:hypothetical protein